ncbi:MAG: hypothetical protein RL333_365 [Pseudomonadota bacterium]|jgi:hypothetical protein
MSIAREVVLRHREPGYVRFDIPEVLCAHYAAEELTRELERVDGVYRVGLNQTAGKLTVRFHDAYCSFETLVRRLLGIVKQVIQRAQAAVSQSKVVIPISSRKPVLHSRPSVAPPIEWIKRKLDELRETFLALKILVSRAVEHRPRWVKEFMNDLLMLFLIKLHWHQILTEWLPRPWTYRYEWLATIYLIYLSVQSKVPQAA